MTVSLLPRVIADKLTDLTPQRLQDMGVELLMMDFDNTIVPYTTDTPTDGGNKKIEYPSVCGIQFQTGSGEDILREVRH